MKLNHFAEIKISLFIRVGFLFDMYAWMQLWANEQGKDVSSILYYAYVSYCKDKGKRVRYNKERLKSIIEKAPNKQVIELNKVLIESTKDLKGIKKEAEGELKKKLT